MIRKLRLPKGLTHLLAAAGIAIACFGLVALWIQESWELSGEIFSKKRQVNEAIRILQSHPVPDAKPSASTRSVLDPKAADPMPALIVRLESLALKCRAEIVTLSPRSLVKQGILESQPFQIKLTGATADLRLFLGRLTALPLVEAEQWSLQQPPGQKAAFLTGHFRAYRLVEKAG